MKKLCNYSLFLVLLFCGCVKKNEKQERLDQQLILAVEAHDLTQVKTLIEQGASPNVKKSGGQPVLIVATKNGKGEIVTHLIQSEADPNLKDEKSRQSLHHASEHGHLDIVKKLLESNAHIDHADDRGQTPLIIASEQGNVEIVGELLLKSAKLDKQDKEGNTALMKIFGSHLTVDQQLAVAKRLVDYGANLHLKNDDGKTALEIAVEQSDPEIIEYLKEVTHAGLK